MRGRIFLEKVLTIVVSQPRSPDDIVISAVDQADMPKIDQTLGRVQAIFGGSGLYKFSEIEGSPI